MTKTEWLTCADPLALLNYLGDNPSVRKRQLFCVACWMEASDALGEGSGSLEILDKYAEDDWFEQCYSVIDVGEHYNIQEEDLTAAFWDLVENGEPEIMEAWQQRTEANLTSWNARSICAGAVLITTLTARFSPPSVAHVNMYDYDCSETPTAAELAVRAEAHLTTLGTKARKQWRKWQKLHANLVREVFGNPLHPVRVAPEYLAWNSGAIRQLAQGIYEERAFDRLPILADALEEAGCTEADLVEHCRSDAKHVRGCWAIDLLLDRK